MAYVNHPPVRTGTAFDDLPPGETMIASINARASSRAGFNPFDTKKVAADGAGEWSYTDERLDGRKVLVVTAYGGIVLAVFKVLGWKHERPNGSRLNKATFKLVEDKELTKALRGERTPYKRKRGQMGGIIFVG